MEVQETQTKAPSKFIIKHRLSDKYVGAEPIWKVSPFDSDEDIKSKQISILNWYNQACDVKHVKKWLYEYIKREGTTKDVLDGFTGIPEIYFYTHQSSGWIARLKLTGAENLQDNFDNRLVNTVKEIKVLAKACVDRQREKIKRLHEGKKNASSAEIEKRRLIELVGTINQMIDVFIDADYKDIESLNEKWFEEHNVTKEQAESISKIYSGQLKELDLVKKKKDIQLVEGYSFLTKKQFTAFYQFIETIFVCSKDWISNPKSSKVEVKIKKLRKPRRRKVKSPADQVKKLKYCMNAPEFLLTSISPYQIVGATQLWVFNIRYRSLGVYNATDSYGFTVKGSTIYNFDEKTSIEKRLRKPGESLKTVLEGGKVPLKHLMENIKTKEKKLKGRINKDVIIVRVL